MPRPSPPSASQRRRWLATAASGAALAAIGAPRVSFGQAAPKFRIGDWPVAAGLPFFAAIDKGYFKDAGHHLADAVLLLTKRPTRVADILADDDPRPRPVETLSQPSFIAAKKLSLEIFQREVRR